MGGLFVGFCHPHSVLCGDKAIECCCFQVELISQHQNQMSYVVHGGSMVVVIFGSAREGGDVVDLCVLAPRGFVHNRQIAHAAQVDHV